MRDSCEGCAHLEREDWQRGKTTYRCQCPAAGRWKGRTLAVTATGNASPYTTVIPAWCPGKENKKGSQE